MYSINFPKMFDSAKTLLISDHEATMQNLILILKSDRGALFGDPYYGTILKKLLFAQNDLVLQDLVIDEIYTTIGVYMPQIKVNRSDIRLTSVGNKIYAEIYCTNLIDYQTDLYSIKLIEDEEK